MRIIFALVLIALPIIIGLSLPFVLALTNWNCKAFCIRYDRQLLLATLLWALLTAVSVFVACL